MRTTDSTCVDLAKRCAHLLLIEVKANCFARPFESILGHEIALNSGQLPKSTESLSC